MLFSYKDVSFRLLKNEKVYKIIKFQSNKYFLKCSNINFIKCLKKGKKEIIKNKKLN